MSSDETGESTAESREVGILIRDDDRRPSNGVFDSLTARDIAFGAFIISAWCYGWIESSFGNATVDMANPSPYPDHAWIFMLFGLSLGVGFTALMVSMQEVDDDD